MRLENARVFALTTFRHLPKRLFKIRWGPGEAECGAIAEGWWECLALRLFLEPTVPLKLVLWTAGRYLPLSPHYPGDGWPAFGRGAFIWRSYSAEGALNVR